MTTGAITSSIYYHDMTCQLGFLSSYFPLILQRQSRNCDINCLDVTLTLKYIYMYIYIYIHIYVCVSKCVTLKNDEPILPAETML